MAVTCFFGVFSVAVDGGRFEVGTMRKGRLRRNVLLVFYSWVASSLCCDRITRLAMTWGRGAALSPATRSGETGLVG